MTAGKKTGNALCGKKAQAFMLLFPTLAFVLGMIVLFFFMSPDIKDTIGLKQAAILKAVPEGEAKLSFVDSSAKLASWDALFGLGRKGGFYFEQGDDARIAEKYPCDTYGYIKWGPENGGTCWPSEEGIAQAYSGYVSDELNLRYFPQHPDKILQGIQYNYNVTTGPLGINISGISGGIFTTKLSYQFETGGKIIPLPEAEKPRTAPAKETFRAEQDDSSKCCSGECVASLAMQYYDRYGPPGLNFPYVWGGETPYGIEESISMSRDATSIFYGVNIQRIQPAGNKRSNQKTIPGFDCSGFVWWTYRNAQMPQFTGRLTAQGYRNLLSKTESLVCLGEACREAIEGGSARPGDLVFLKSQASGVANHIAIYIGGGRVVDSTGDTDGIANRPIPKSWYSRIEIRRPEYNAGCSAGQDPAQPPQETQQVQVAPEPSPAQDEPEPPKAVSISVPASQAAVVEKINRDYSELIRQSLTPDDVKRGVSEPLVKALIMLESAGNPDAVSSTGCSGLMQFCAGTAYDYGLCDNKACSGRDDRKSPEKAIPAGIKYLSRLMVQFGKYDHRDAMALTAYNAGPGLVTAAIRESGEKNPDFWNELLPNHLMNPKLICEVYKWTDEKKCRDKADREIRVYAKKISDYLSFFGAPSLSVVYYETSSQPAQQVTAGTNPGSASIPTPTPAPQALGKPRTITKEDFGLYDVNPSFTTRVEYDLSVYSRISDWAKETYNSCSGIQGRIADCVSNKTREQDAKYEQFTAKENKEPTERSFRFSDPSTCDGELSGFYSFVESFEDCLEFSNTACSCRIPYGSLDANSGVTRIIITNDTITFENSLTGAKEYYDLSKNKQSGLMINSAPAEAVTITRDPSGYSASDEGGNRVSGEIYLHREPSGEGYTLSVDTRKDAVCDLESGKHKFRLCAIGDQQALSFDQASGKFEYSDVPIMFALDLKKAPPPKIGGVAIPTDGSPEQGTDSGKFCEGFGSAQIELKASTRDLLPEFNQFTKTLSQLLPIETRLSLFLPLALQKCLDAAINVKIDFNHASEKCDIKGIVYKCGTGLPPLKDGKFDFSSPDGFIDLSSRFGAKKTGLLPQGSRFSLKNPQGLLKDAKYILPEFDRGADEVSFAISQCQGKISQLGQGDGSLLSKAAIPAGYYFAFAYIDSNGNYGPTTFKTILMTPVVEQLLKQLGVASNYLYLAETFVSNPQMIYDSLLGDLAQNREYLLFRKALAARSFDTLLQDLTLDARQELLGRISERLGESEAAEMFERISKYGLSDDYAREFLYGLTDRITAEEADKIVRKAYEKIDDYRGPLGDALRNLDLQSKRDLLYKLYNKDYYRTLSEYEANKQINKLLEKREDLARAIDQLGIEDKLAIARDIMAKNPAKALALLEESLDSNRKLELIRENLAKSQSELARMMANISPDALKKEAIERITESLGLPDLSNPLDLICQE